MYKPYLVAMSHLSDAQELMSMGQSEQATIRINFAKWIISRYKTNMVSEFNADLEWTAFNNRK